MYHPGEYRYQLSEVFPEYKIISMIMEMYLHKSVRSVEIIVDESEEEIVVRDTRKSENDLRRLIRMKRLLTGNNIEDSDDREISNVYSLNWILGSTHYYRPAYLLLMGDIDLHDFGSVWRDLHDKVSNIYSETLERVKLLM
jgi:hypothetical protein